MPLVRATYCPHHFSNSIMRVEKSTSLNNNQHWDSPQSSFFLPSATYTERAMISDRARGYLQLLFLFASLQRHVKCGDTGDIALLSFLLLFVYAVS